MNKELRRKSQELQKATNQLTEANEQLKKYGCGQRWVFCIPVTHELRTPVTSIRAMAEIVHDNEDMTEEERRHFYRGWSKETER